MSLIFSSCFFGFFVVPSFFWLNEWVKCGCFVAYDCPLALSIVRSFGRSFIRTYLWLSHSVGSSFFSWIACSQMCWAKWGLCTHLALTRYIFTLDVSLPCMYVCVYNYIYIIFLHHIHVTDREDAVKMRYVQFILYFISSVICFLRACVRVFVWCWWFGCRILMCVLL